MIINFEFENWMSFKDKTEFSAVARAQTEHRERLSDLADYNKSLLPISAIYGANATGKSNFFEAIKIFRNLIIENINFDSKIPTSPFLLDDSCVDMPTKFKMIFLVGKRVYEYGLSVYGGEFQSEKLVEFGTKAKTVIFSRDTKDIEVSPEIDSSHQELLKGVIRYTRTNQLFLTNTMYLNVDLFAHIYDWFKNSLILISPRSKEGRFQDLFDEGMLTRTDVGDMLYQLDTGIVGLSEEAYNFENLNMTEGKKERLIYLAMQGQKPTIQLGDSTFVVQLENSTIVAKKLMTLHESDMMSKIEFDLKQESDGTQRLIDILPSLFLFATRKNITIVVDELDSSLHSFVTKGLVDSYLSLCYDSNFENQFIFTTHDLNLMDQKIFRRDEIWLTDRSINGVSSLTSLGKFKGISYEDDILDFYKKGRVSGIPHLLFRNSEINPLLNARNRGK